MSLINYAKDKALNFIESVYRQADSDIFTGTGSAIRSMVILPMSLIFSSVFNEIERLRNYNMGNVSRLGRLEMKNLFLNFIQEVPQGSRSVCTVRVYTSKIEEFSLSTIPYFFTSRGVQFQPARNMNFGTVDFLEENGEFYVNVPVMAVTEGSNGNVDIGGVQFFKNMPISVRRVDNLEAAREGSDELTNAEALAYLQKALSDGTTIQIGGVQKYLTLNYSQAEYLIVRAGDPLMKRDEVWTVDYLVPNLEFSGEPWATHRAMGVVNPNSNYGRLKFDDTLTQADVGKRIAISGDIEQFRKILKVSGSHEAIVSGPAIETGADAKILGNGPKIRSMSDVYLYFPSLEIQSIIVDKRQFLTTTANRSGNLLRFSAASGFAYSSYYDSGKIVVNEGLDSEQVFTVSSIGSDTIGDYMILNESGSINSGTNVSYYSMSNIYIGEDITDTPIIYVLQIDSLDPLSFDYVSTIPSSMPGNYEQPGWYIKDTRSSDVFSTRERKTIKIDEKSTLDGFREFSYTGGYAGASKRIFLTADWNDKEGREVSVSISKYSLPGQETAELSVASGAGTSTMVITGLSAPFFEDIGYRKDIGVSVLNSSNIVIETLYPGSVKMYGSTIEKISGTFGASADSVYLFIPSVVGSFPSPSSTMSVCWKDAVLYRYIGAGWEATTADVGLEPTITENTFEDIIKSTNGSSYIDVFAISGITSVYNGTSYINTSNISITGAKSSGNWVSAPMRIVYATRSSFADIQNDLDNQNLCDDTLVRSFYPTLIDSSVSYRGNSTSAEIFERFIDLLQESIKEKRSEDEYVRIDMSNIVSALDEEGLADSFDVNFEIKVINYLDDGEYEVRYLNPSERTKQVFAVNSNITNGSNLSTITLKRLSSTSEVSGRGKLFLGGNNPSAQEVVPYEAVVDNGDGTYTFIIRSGYVVKYAHTQWESAVVTVRDYDPELEYDAAIYIPKNNRPYVRNLSITRESVV